MPFIGKNYVTILRFENALRCFCSAVTSAVAACATKRGIAANGLTQKNACLYRPSVLAWATLSPAQGITGNSGSLP